MYICQYFSIVFLFIILAHLMINPGLDKLVSEHMAQGQTIEVRQYANAMVAASEIWGLQLPYLLGKKYQVRIF